MNHPHWTAREILGLFLLFGIGVLSLGAWQAFFTVMLTPGLTDLWRPAVWFFFLAVVFFLGAAVWKTQNLRLTAATLLFVPGLLFIRSWEFWVAVALSIVFAFLSIWSSVLEFNQRVRFHFIRSVRNGSFFLICGLSLSLATGYYTFLKYAAWEELVPRFRIGEEMTQLIFRTAGIVNPSFRALSQGEITVDEFLLSLQREQGRDPAVAPIVPTMPIPESSRSDARLTLPSDAPSALTARDNPNPPVLSEEIAQAFYLQSGRAQIAMLTGRPVQGNEKMSDIFSHALQRKLIALLDAKEAGTRVSSPAIPFFLSLLLFITLISFLSLLAVVCMVLASLALRVMLWLGWLRLKRRAVEQEVLAD